MKKILFALSVFFFGQSAFAYDFSAVAPSGQTLYYNIIDYSNHYVEVTYGSARMPMLSDLYVEDSTRPVGNVVIPSNVFYAGNNYCVRNIGRLAFFGCRHMKIVTIPQSIDTINDDAFHYCDSLYKVCYFAKKATVKSNYYTSVAWSPFYHDYLTGNTSIHILQLGDSVQTIAAYLFSCCHNLGGNIVFPNSVKKIGKYAFSNTKINTITLPENLDTLGGAAFWGCDSLCTVYYNPKNCRLVNVATRDLFGSCNALTCIYFGDNVESIPGGLCSGIASLTGTLQFPAGLKSIGTGAFYYCSGLTGQIIVPDSVTFIGQGAFSNCGGISTITLGRNIDSIGSGAFGYMSSVHTINYNAQNIQGNSAQLATSGTTNVTSFNIREGVCCIPNYFIDNCPNLTTITFPNSVTSIGISNFAHCGLSGNLNLPNELMEIGAGAFAACTNLTSITCPAIVPPNIIQSFGLTYIFSHCWNIPLYVPCSNINAYQSAVGWSNFTNISGIGDCNYTVTLSVNNTTMGSVSGGGTYTQGASATISATANSGYHFDHWSDGSMQNPRTLIVTSNISLMAYFEANVQSTNDVITDNANICTSGGQIVVETEQKNEIRIYDIVGRKVDGGYKSRFEIPTSGMYFVKIGNRSAQKVIVIK